MSGVELEIPQGMHIANTGPDPTDTPAPEREPTPRERQMLGIVANAERQRGMELAYGEEQLLESRRRAIESDPLLEAEEAAVAEDEATERARHALETAPQPAAPAQPQAPVAQPQPAQLRVVQIDGNQFPVTDAQYDQLARDGMLARQTVAQYQRQAQQQPQPVPQPQAPQPLITEEESRHIAKRLQYGDEAESAQVIRQLAETIAQRQPRQPQLDPEAVINAAVQRSQQQQTLNHNLNTIGQEYPEIFNSRVRSQVAALHLGELRLRNQALGVNVPDLDLYREACNIVRTELGGGQQLQPNSPDVPQPALQAASALRLDRKRAAPSVPHAADRRAGSTPPRAHQSNADYVEALRRQRGQVPMR